MRCRQPAKIGKRKSTKRCISRASLCIQPRLQPFEPQRHTAYSYYSTRDDRWSGDEDPAVAKRCGPAPTTGRSRSPTKRHKKSMGSPQAGFAVPWTKSFVLASSTSPTVAMVSGKTLPCTRYPGAGNTTGRIGSARQGGQSRRRRSGSRNGISMARTPAIRIHRCYAQQLTTVTHNSWPDQPPAFFWPGTGARTVGATVTRNSVLKTPPRVVKRKPVRVAEPCDAQRSGRAGLRFPRLRSGGKPPEKRSCIVLPKAAHRQEKCGRTFVVSAGRRPAFAGRCPHAGPGLISEITLL